MSDLTQEQITKLQEEFKQLQATLKAAGALPKAERKRERVTEYFDVQSALLTVVNTQMSHIEKLFDLSKTADTKNNIGATWITFKPENCKFGFAVINKAAEEQKRANRETEKAAKEKAEADAKAETTDETETPEGDTSENEVEGEVSNG